jgi:hypothetical protein
MKRLLAVLLSLVLVVMTAAELKLAHLAPACRADAAAACPMHPRKDPDRAPLPGATCLQCCLTACAMIVPQSIAVAAPTAAKITWNALVLGGPTRGDKPPLPPPRVG